MVRSGRLPGNDKALEFGPGSEGMKWSRNRGFVYISIKKAKGYVCPKAEDPILDDLKVFIVWFGK